MSASRSVIQSNSRNGLRSPLDQYEDMQKARILQRNGRGNYYRHQQKLWSSPEQLEKELTNVLYNPVERMPIALLPKRQSPLHVFACEGRGGTALLEAETALVVTQNSSLASNPTGSGSGETLCNSGAEQTPTDVDVMEELLSANSAIENKILTEKDVDGTVLESARQRARQIIEEDLSQHGFRRSPASSSDVAGVSWAALGLDAALAAAAEALFGSAPSRLQSRLLPALLNEDHNDVLFNGTTGSGKTSALLLAALHGIRNEDAGMNVLVASNTLAAMRLHDTVTALCRRAGGGAAVDRPVEDYSWLMIGTCREDYETYYKRLRRSLHGAHGPVRLLITTADVVCQLLFEKKMEFEDFGYLRRVYVDEIGTQIPMLSDTAPVAEVRERLRNPLAAELLLGTLHQLPGPHIRSILQLGLVSADVDGRLKRHLQALCLKPVAQTTVLSAVRVPSTVHCLFSFFTMREDPEAFLVRLLWIARDTIPGRVILFVPDTADVLTQRRRLRGLGMDARIFSEIYGNGGFEASGEWKFLLLKESEAFGVEIPHVSHVIVTFPPTTWQRHLHLCSRTGRMGNVGWVYTICDKRAAAAVRQVAEDLSIDFVNHVVDGQLQQVDPTDVERMTKAPELYGLDPQYAVQQHYAVQAENPEAAYRKREFFSKPVIQQFQQEDYTPIPIKQRRFTNTTKLSHDVMRNPQIVVKMRKEGLLDARLKPTNKLRKSLNQKVSKSAPDPFAK